MDALNDLPGMCHGVIVPVLSKFFKKHFVEEMNFYSGFVGN